MSDGPISAAFAARIAEAADGLRDGKEYYFLIVGEASLTVFGHPTKQAAEEDRDSRFSGQTARIVGPYKTDPDPGLRQDKLKVRRITVEFDQGEPQEIDPSKVDALFWSASALDKFLFPYYTAMYTSKFANDMRMAYIQDRREVMVYHDPFSNPGYKGLTSTEELLKAAFLR